MGLTAEQDNNENLLYLGSAAKAAGISTQSLQYYLLVGLVEPSAYSRGGRQLFNEKTVSRIRIIHQLNKTGYPLREIRNIFFHPPKNN